MGATPPARRPVARVGAAVHTFDPRPAGAAARAPAVVGEPPEPRRAHGAAETAWVAESAALVDELLAIGDPEACAEAFAALAGRLTRTGEALRPEDAARVLRSFGPGVGAAEPARGDFAELAEEHRREMAAWRAEPAERDATLVRRERRLEILAWAAWLAAAALLLAWLLR